MHLRYCAPLIAAAAFAFTLACSSPPQRPTIPALTPQTAAELLHYNNQAQSWLTYVRRQDPTCTYSLDLPDQRTHPTEIDLNHIVSCGGHPSPPQYSAEVSFVYDATRHAWVITRFSS